MSFARSLRSLLPLAKQPSVHCEIVSLTRRTSCIPTSIRSPLSVRSISSSAWRLDSASNRGEGIKAKWVPAEGNDTKGPLKFDQTPKLSLTFTCTAQIPDPNAASSSLTSDAKPASAAPDGSETLVPCHHRSTHQFSKQAYTQGIVLVQCPGCQNRHLIADHLGWFKEITEGKGSERLKTIEDIMQEKGEVVKTGVLTEGGVTEIL